MDTSSKMTRESHKSSELEKFKLFYEFVPVKKPSARLKRSHASGA